MVNACFTNGSIIEVSSDEPGFIGAWYVATFIKETKNPPTKNNINKTQNVNNIYYLVKFHTLLDDNDPSKPLTEVVDPAFVRPMPPRNVRRNVMGSADVVVVDGVAVESEFEVGDVVDADHRDGWWMGVVKNVIVDVEGESEKKYVVLFENPNEELEFERCKLRLHIDWVDYCWIIPPKKTLEHETVDRNGTHENETGSGFTTPAKGARTDNGTVSTPISAKKYSRSRKTSESNSTVDSLVTRSKNRKRTLNSVEDGSRGKRFQSLSVLDGNGVAIDMDEQPLSVWYRGIRRIHRLSVSKKSSCVSSLDQHVTSTNQAIVISVGTTTNYQQNWPFIKRSPIWSAIELSLIPPQRPHFSPLKKMNEDYREGLAIAHMVTFGNIVKKLSELKSNDPVVIMNNSLEALSDLETHGFDVGPIRDRLNEMLSLKSKISQHEVMRKEVEKELEKCKHEESLEDKEMDELKVKMQELKEKMAQIAITKKAKEEQMKSLESKLHVLFNEIEELAATPL